MWSSVYPQGPDKAEKAIAFDRLTATPEAILLFFRALPFPFVFLEESCCPRGALERLSETC